MFARTKKFVADHQETFGRVAIVGAVAGVVGAQLLQNQRRANAKADAVRQDLLTTVEDYARTKTKDN